MMNYESLEKFMPKEAVPFFEQWMHNIPLKLIVAKDRKSKLGDYRKLGLKGHQITVNGSLNLHAFFFVLTHEIAHLIVEIEYGNRNVKPHGKEWKTIFGKLIIESINVYPVDIHYILLNHAKNPKAILGSDPALYKHVIYAEKKGLSLEDLKKGQIFRLGNKIMKKQDKKKIRYICRDIYNGRYYLVNGKVFVDQIIE